MTNDKDTAERVVPEEIWAKAGFRQVGPFTSQRDWGTGRGDWSLEPSVYTSAKYIRADIVEAERREAALKFLADEGQRCDAIEAAVLKERERCAKIADSQAQGFRHCTQNYENGREDAGLSIAAAIREDTQ